MTSWRDKIQVHPAAELLPLIDDGELRKLAADIREHGLHHRVVFERHGGMLLDGRNRLDAIELAFAEDPQRAESEIARAIELAAFNPPGDPWDYVISANLVRRHLNREQTRELLAALLKRQPERSDRATAELANVSHHTVASVRKDLEATGQLAQLRERVGADGKAQGPRRETTAIPPTVPTAAANSSNGLEAGGQFAHLSETEGGEEAIDPTDSPSPNNSADRRSFGDAEAGEEIPHLTERAAADQQKVIHQPKAITITFSPNTGEMAQRVFDALFAWFGTEAPEGCDRFERRIMKAPLRAFYDEYNLLLQQRIGGWMNDRKREDRLRFEKQQTAKAAQAASKPVRGKGEPRKTRSAPNIKRGAMLH